jgi:DNA processing protein
MVSTPDELRAWLRLCLTPGIGNTTARSLLQAFGLPQTIFSSSAGELQHVVSPSQSQALLQIPSGLDMLCEDTWKWLSASPIGGVQRRLLTLADAEYPSPLLATCDPPCVLYAMGQTQHLARLGQPTLEAPAALAMVGSRNPTPQGLQNAHDFALSLAHAGLSVVSGLALGVDGAAHEGALIGGTPSNPIYTVAVVGTGLDRVYPKSHQDLAHRIAHNGLLLSEYHLGTPPITANFPKRNRLIAGLSQGCLVVEAAMRSGSLITARQALELGKDVFAIPGSIHSSLSKGCHGLIRQGAKLVESAQDVLEELRHVPQNLQAAPSRNGLALAHEPANAHASASLSNLPGALENHHLLLQCLGHDPVGLDELQQRSQLGTAQLQSQLFNLELAGAVGRLPGGQFQRLVKN